MKAIGWLIGIVLLVVVGLGVYLVMNAGSLLKTAVETLGPEYLGVDVRLGSAEISLSDGTGELRGLVVGNPAGFDGPHALSLGLVRLGLDPMAQSDSLVVVRELVVDNADLAIVARGSETNLAAIMENLEDDTAADAGPAEGAAPDTDTKIIIDRFAFTNAQTSLDSDLLGDSSVEIPDIVLEGIGRKSQGVTIREALQQLFRPIVQAAGSALAQKNLNVDEIKANAEEKLDDVLEEKLGTDLKGLKDRFNR